MAEVALTTSTGEALPVLEILDANRLTVIDEVDQVIAFAIDKILLGIEPQIWEKIAIGEKEFTRSYYTPDSEITGQLIGYAQHTQQTVGDCAVDYPICPIHMVDTPTRFDGINNAGFRQENSDGTFLQVMPVKSTYRATIHSIDRRDLKNMFSALMILKQSGIIKYNSHVLSEENEITYTFADPQLDLQTLEVVDDEQKVFNIQFDIECLYIIGNNISNAKPIHQIMVEYGFKNTAPFTIPDDISFITRT